MTTIPTWLKPVSVQVYRPVVPFNSPGGGGTTFAPSKLAPSGGIFWTGTRTASPAAPLRGGGILPNPSPYRAAVPFLRSTVITGTFAPTYLPILAGEVESDYVARAADDYHTRFYFGSVPAVRTIVYTAPEDVDVAIIRQVSISNTLATDETFQMWIAGLKFIPTMTIPAEEPPVGEDYPVLALKPGEHIEVQGSALGLNLFIDGIESVR